jgi:hypothetical protein
MKCPNCVDEYTEKGALVSVCTNHVGPKLTVHDMLVVVPCPNCRRIDRYNFICLGPVHHYWNTENPCGEIGQVDKYTVVVNVSSSRRFQLVFQPGWYVRFDVATRQVIESIQAKAVILGHMTWKETVMYEPVC